LGRSVLRVVEFGIAGAAALLLVPVWALPWRGGICVARAYGLLAAAVNPKARRVAAINLRRAYGSALERSAANRLAWTVCANMAQSLGEGIQFVTRLRRGIEHSILFEVEDAELDQRIRADPRPKIFVTGHLGSWEVMTIVAGMRHGARQAVIVRGIDNPFLDWMFRRLRVRAGAAIVEKRGGAAAASAHLRAGTSVAMLVDENAGRRGVFVDFFGRPASTSRLPALLALATASPIVLGVAVRGAKTPDGRSSFRCRLALFEPDAYRRPDDESASVRTLTQAVVRQYEAWIREAPSQWRWIHWRWKTRPDGTEETYLRRDLALCYDSALAQPPFHR
jgi:KDO2-lipid IV(A) lauroyltransferase